jgi:hypothetical protein
MVLPNPISPRDIRLNMIGRSQKMRYRVWPFQNDIVESQSSFQFSHLEFRLRTLTEPVGIGLRFEMLRSDTKADKGVATFLF